MSYRDRYEQWIAKLPADDPMREELIAIRDNDEEIKERFYTEIEFGTAGLRGIRGAGTNRMNRLTVGRATQGIANYILASGEDTLTTAGIFPRSSRSSPRRSLPGTGSRRICSRLIGRLPSCPSRSGALRRSAAST